MYNQPRKRGFALLIVLVLSALISVSAIALYNAAHLDTLIAGNKRRSMVASFASDSGVNHFMSLNIPVSELSRSIRDHSGVSRVILRDIPLDPHKTFYTVTVRICCDRNGGLLPEDTVIIESEGRYMKGDRVISLHKITATVTETSANILE